MRILSLFLFLFFLTGCFEEPKKSTSTLVIKSNVITAQLTGGVMIWGVGPNNMFMALSLLDETQKKEVELAVGTWHLFSVGWMGANKLTGAQKCGATNITLIEGVPATVSFNMTTANCGGSDFSPAGHLSSNQFLPLKLITCNNITGLAAGNNCDGAAKGGAKSYKLFFSEYNSSFAGSAPVPGLFTPCLNASGATNSVTTSTFPIPVGKTGFWPMHTVLEVYDGVSCTGMKKNFIFMDGLKNAVQDTLVFAGTGYTEVFVKTQAMAPNISYSSSYNINQTIPISTIIPTNIGGSSTSWTATGLPAGLTINATSGAITGTASGATATYTVTVSATNASGTGTYTFNIVLLPAPPVIGTYTQNSAIYINGQTGIVNTPTISGGAVDSFSISPALGNGLSINTTTGVISGSATGTLAATNYTITATNSGGNDIHVVTISVVQPANLSISEVEPYDYGTKATGSVTDKTFTVSNSGGFTAASISGSGLASPYEFKGGSYPGVGGNCGVSIGAGVNCTIVVSFSPVSTGTFTDIININYNNGISAVMASRSVQAVAANPALLSISDGPTYDFGQKILTQFGYKQFTITNSGGVDATEIVDIGLASPFSFNGVYPGAGGTCGSTLPAGNTCILELKYNPTIVGSNSDALDLSYHDGVTYQNAIRAIQGNAVNPALLTITSPSNNFDFHVKYMYPATPAFIANWDASSNTPTLVNASGSPGQYYVVTTAGSAGGFGTFLTNDWIMYDGAIWKKVPPKVFQTFTVLNGAGRASANISGITGYTTPFSIVSNSCSGVLASGSSCTFNLYFAPTTFGKETQNLSIGYNDGLGSTSTGLTVQGKGGEIIDVASADGISTCAVFQHGQVKCWGDNSSGQLGYGNTISRGDNVNPSMGSNLGFVPLNYSVFKVKKIVGGNGFFCALSDSGSVRCWGNNAYGQLGANLSNTEKIGDDANEISTLGSLSLGGTVVDIDAENYNVCVLISGGSIKCWGYNLYGQLGIDSSTDSFVPVNVSGSALTSLNKISVGKNHVCAKKTMSGEYLYCWGSSDSGQLGKDTNASYGDTAGDMNNISYLNTGVLPGLTDMVAGSELTCGKTSSGYKCWGLNDSGQLGRANNSNSNISDGTGPNFTTLSAAISLPTGTYSQMIITANNEVCVLRDTGDVFCWGNGSFGGLGQGDAVSKGAATGTMGSFTPQINLGTNRIAKKLSNNSTCAILDNGELKCWGKNGSGQLGLGDINHRGDASGEMGDNLPYVELH